MNKVYIGVLLEIITLLPSRTMLRGFITIFFSIKNSYFPGTGAIRRLTMSAQSTGRSDAVHGSRSVVLLQRKVR